MLARCSNQTDLHLTFIDPIRPAGLRQRPSLTFMPLATDQVVRRTVLFGSSQELSDEVSDNRHRQRWTPADTHGRSVPGQACCGAGSPRLYLASGRRGRRFKSGHPDRETAGHKASNGLLFVLRVPGCPILGACWERRRWQWTRKVAAKTICRWLSPEQHRDYTAWIDNDRRLHELLARLEALGAAALEADPRWNR